MTDSHYKSLASWVSSAGDIASISEEHWEDSYQGCFESFTDFAEHWACARYSIAEDNHIWEFVDMRQIRNRLFAGGDYRATVCPSCEDSAVWAICKGDAFQVLEELGHSKW